MLTLNVNIDHVATVRNARGGKEPDPVTAALKAELAGASGIVAHLREDRRHINDRDVRMIKELIQVKFDLEMSAADEIVAIALDLTPNLVTIVPEKRQELTTEGGLDVAGNLEKYKKLCGKMHEKDIQASFFVEPDERQIEASLRAGADMVELHTGAYANASNTKDIENELSRIGEAARFAGESGLMVAAGHGINYINVKPVCQFPEIQELSIGHSIISRAVFTGIAKAVWEMIETMTMAILPRNLDE